MSIYSDSVGLQIDNKFNMISFGTNLRGLNQRQNPFRRNDGVYKANTRDIEYPGFAVPPCTFETKCCNMPSNGITVSGRLKECDDFNLDQRIGGFIMGQKVLPFTKKYTTRTIGLDATEN